MSEILTNHDQVKKWIEERDGVPAAVATTVSKDPVQIPVIRIWFPKTSTRGKGLVMIKWEDFFYAFDQCGLALLCSDKTKEGELSRFFKFIKRK